MKRIIVLLLFITVWVFSGFAADRELFLEAEGRYNSGNFSAALDLYTRFINENRISPEVPDAQFKRAVSLYQLGRTGESFKLFSEIKKTYSSTSYIVMVPFWQGRISLLTEDYRAAADFFDEFIRAGSGQLLFEAYLYRAMSYDKLGRPSDAAYSLELLLDRDDFSDDGYITALLSSLYLKQGKYGNVLELADARSRTAFLPDYSNQLMLHEAEARYMTEDLSGAEELYSALAELDDPRMSVAWQRLFTIFRRTGRDDGLSDLLSDAEKALGDRPDILGDFRMRIGIASYNSGDFKTAEKYFLAIWDTSSPSEIDGLVPLYYSKLLEQNGNAERAVEILEIFLGKSGSRRAEILVRLAELYTNERNYSNGERRLDDFFKDYSETGFFYEAAYLKSFICYRGGRYDEALEWVARSYSADSRGERTASLLRLESTLLKKKGNYGKAAEKLERYLGYKPDDVNAELDLFRLRFLLEEYKRILDESVEFKWRPEVREDDAKAYLLSSYITGLSAIALSDYKRAIDELLLINPVNSNDYGLAEIYPYALFYTGWAYYRNSEYGRASSAFEELVNSYTESEASPEAAYLAGWCEYILGNYEKSSAFFLDYSGLEKDGGKKGWFMYAKNLAALERYREAANIFAEIARDNEESALADDALFEKAALYALLGDTEQAAADYEYLFRRYGGLLAEEGLFRRGELFYDAGRFPEAATAFYTFRRNYPDSRMFDAALYWGGMSLKENAEDFGAVLLWENIIDNYRDSIFRAPAMLKAAETYSDAGDYSTALGLYERCRLEYPGTERAAVAADESEKLRLLISGLSEREAELNVIITREGGAGSPEGRRAMIELSALYISMGGSDLKPALSMLHQIGEHADEDPEAAADARYYIGEYYYRQNNYPEAVKYFLEAAGINPSDKDSSARALYRAADTAVLAGSRGDAEKLIKRLREYYPDTEWAVEAAKLLKGAE